MNIAANIPYEDFIGELMKEFDNAEYYIRKMVGSDGIDLYVDKQVLTFFTKDKHALVNDNIIDLAVNILNIKPFLPANEFIDWKTDLKQEGIDAHLLDVQWFKRAIEDILTMFILTYSLVKSDIPIEGIFRSIYPDDSEMLFTQAMRVGCRLYSNYPELFKGIDMLNCEIPAFNSAFRGFYALDYGERYYPETEKDILKKSIEAQLKSRYVQKMRKDMQMGIDRILKYANEMVDRYANCKISGFTDDFGITHGELYYKTGKDIKDHIPWKKILTVMVAAGIFDFGYQKCKQFDMQIDLDDCAGIFNEIIPDDLVEYSFNIFRYATLCLRMYSINLNHLIFGNVSKKEYFRTFNEVFSAGYKITENDSYGSSTKRRLMFKKQ